MNYVALAHLAYLGISIGLTVWVARTLSRAGRVFLVDAFLGNRELAESVDHLLVVGFYLVNLGFAALALKHGAKPVDLPDAIEALSSKIGLILLALGAMHFFNLYVLSRLRKRAMLRTRKAPVLPDEMFEPLPQFAV